MELNCDDTGKSEWLLLLTSDVDNADISINFPGKKVPCSRNLMKLNLKFM